MSAGHQCETTVCPYKRTSKKCFLLTGITSVFATTGDGFTFLRSQVFRRVNWRFCDLYSAVILRQGLLCSRSPLFNRAVWSGAVLSGLAISAPPLISHCYVFYIVWCQIKRPFTNIIIPSCYEWFCAVYGHHNLMLQAAVSSSKYCRTYLLTYFSYSSCNYLTMMTSIFINRIRLYICVCFIATR